VIAILDIDGTLVDTSYHHAIAWYRAFRRNGVVLPVWRIHRHMGMGGDQVIAALAGDEVEAAKGSAIRDAEAELYSELIEEVEAIAGARELVVELKDRGHTVVLASSGKADDVDRYLDLLSVRDVADAWTTSADVEATKPEPDLVRCAIDKAGSGPAVMVGDTPWDVIAAKRAGVDTLTVLTGGYSERELRAAGALAVFESVVELRDRLAETPLAA
jgi:HAD superfamily hydrolase (TIGR01549 family)